MNEQNISGQNMDGQKRMESYVKKTMQEIKTDQKDLLNDMMNGEVVDCCFEDNSVTVRFLAQPWQGNRVGNMHGGALCTAFDISMAILARFLANSNFTPTISIEVKFLRPIQIGDYIDIKTTATLAGKRISHFVSEAVNVSTGKLIATSTSVYMNIDTTLEKR